MYLTYNKYEDMGGTLDETAFTNLEFEARKFVDWVTFNRLKDNMPTIIPEELEYCMFQLIDFINIRNNAIASGAGTEDSQMVGSISNQKNDGVSVSYNVLSARQSIILAQQEMNRITNRYLNDTRDSLNHLVLFRGKYSDE